MRHIFFTLACVFCLFIVYPMEATGPDKKLHEKCLYPTIQIINSNDKPTGTGVIVRSIKLSEKEYCNIFLTCNHVVSNEIMTIRVFQYEKWSSLKGQQSFTAWFYAHHSTNDMAIGYFLTPNKMPTSDIDFDAEIFIGTDIFRIGCGSGDEPRLDYGKVTSVRNKLMSVDTIRTSIFTIPGDSGSPVFYNNKIIGIMVSIRSSRNGPLFNISYAIPVENFQKWSRDYNNNLDFVWKEQSVAQMPIHIIRFLNAYSFERVETLPTK